MQNHGKNQGKWLFIGMSVEMHHTYLKVACEQRVIHLTPLLELGPLLLQLHVSVVPVIRIRHNIIYQKIL